ncbi:hypothetical protein ACFLY6_02405 [Candidatus Dependentiae bacterium]
MKNFKKTLILILISTVISLTFFSTAQFMEEGVNLKQLQAQAKQGNAQPNVTKNNELTLFTINSILISLNTNNGTVKKYSTGKILGREKDWKWRSTSPSEGKKVMTDVVLQMAIHIATEHIKKKFSKDDYQNPSEWMENVRDKKLLPEKTYFVEKIEPAVAGQRKIEVIYLADENKLLKIAPTKVQQFSKGPIGAYTWDTPSPFKAYLVLERLVELPSLKTETQKMFHQKTGKLIKSEKEEEKPKPEEEEHEEEEEEEEDMVTPHQQTAAAQMIASLKSSFETIDPKTLRIRYYPKTDWPSLRTYYVKRQLDAQQIVQVGDPHPKYGLVSAHETYFLAGKVLIIINTNQNTVEQLMPKTLGSGYKWKKVKPKNWTKLTQHFQTFITDFIERNKKPTHERKSTINLPKPPSTPATDRRKVTNPNFNQAFTKAFNIIQQGRSTLKAATAWQKILIHNPVKTWGFSDDEIHVKIGHAQVLSIHRKEKKTEEEIIRHKSEVRLYPTGGTIGYADDYMSQIENIIVKIQAQPPIDPFQRERVENLTAQFRLALEQPAAHAKALQEAKVKAGPQTPEEAIAMLITKGKLLDNLQQQIAATKHLED